VSPPALAKPMSLRARRDPLASPEQQLAVLDSLPLSTEFHQALADSGLWPLRPTGLEVLQLNVGKLCNQVCRHCHVDAGPDRPEQMSQQTMAACLEVVARHRVPTVDITGGAPELNPHFRWLVAEARRHGAQVIDRCNLSILETGPCQDLPAFFAEHQVEVVCSLPHYRQLGTDRQRGEGIYEKSIAALRRLNAHGYGDGASCLRLVLVSNPVGAFLPGGQASMEEEWKRELHRLHGIRFDALYTITNMPISRYLEWLQLSGNLEAYLTKLVAAYNPTAARGVMCRSLLSVSWDGRLFDCDFNQMLELPLEEGAPGHIAQFDLERYLARNVRVARHCFGCTAGAGSSCGGATSG
jgi:radical SAM/Cys-rich protein